MRNRHRGSSGERKDPGVQGEGEDLSVVRGEGNSKGGHLGVLRKGDSTNQDVGSYHKKRRVKKGGFSARAASNGGRSEDHAISPNGACKKAARFFRQIEKVNKPAVTTPGKDEHDQGWPSEWTILVSDEKVQKKGKRSVGRPQTPRKKGRTRVKQKGALVLNREKKTR